MTRTTKTQIQSDILHLAETLLAASTLLEDDPDDPDLFGMNEEDTECFSDDISDVLDLAALNWVELAQYMAGDGSRGTYDQIAKSKDFFGICLRAPDREFRHMFRVGRDLFDYLVQVLAPNPIFLSKGRRPQRHVKYQLGCFLIRYGSIGSDTIGTAQKLSIGFGTVFLYCRRVTRAIRELRTQFVGWPTAERKTVIRRDIKDRSGFAKCLGAGDGSLIRFCEVPREDGHLFQSRKKFFGTNMQATCDHEKRFTSFELGWPGAVTDSKIWKNSDIWQRRHLYFENNEYILVDKGYPSSPYTVRPFDEPEIAAATAEDKGRMRAFNHRLSSVRIVIEHAFGLLKGRFPSLRGMGAHNSVQDMYRVIEALIILHNIAIDFKDKPDERWCMDENPDDQEDENDADDHPLVQDVLGPAQVPAYETAEWLKERGRMKRLAILNLLF
ncbi:DDE Tnp4 domain-containing protein [Mycena venus]|uniref:DDE Tnp4 domain-containing protein n=1 Tax=Mycena venus TaxID=2733690 RepID=A0A8H6YRK3_9AGAR|nr:DDE Tnp4 domain-containing protein [Mycena venus]